METPPVKIVAWSIAFFFLACVAAQGGEIHGRVLNSEGNPVPGAKVLVEKDRPPLRKEVFTTTEGTYLLADLEQGVYSVTASGPGGRPALRRDVVVGTPESSARMDFRLPALDQQTAGSNDEGNPNIFVYRIDLNALRKRLTAVRGPDTQYIPEFQADQNYFGAEFGPPLREFIPLSRRPVASGWNSSISELFEHSVLNARPFFNVGPLRPSRFNQYQASTGGPLIFNKLSATARFGKLYNSGEVNGNVQVPKLNERTPLSDDPRVNQIVASLLRAYPLEEPNLPQVTERQLNTNAPRKIDSTDGLIRLDFNATPMDAVVLRYSISDYAEDPFELTIGQNPQTDLRNQGLHLSWTRTFSPESVGRIGFHYDRSKAELKPTQRFLDLFAPLGAGTAVPDVNFRADTFQDLGPGEIFPRKRVQNLFQFYGDFTQIVGRHTLKMGWGTARAQVNDLQSDNSRGNLIFADDFGRSELTNFLLGKPSQLLITQGNLYRGFRNWEHDFYFGDQIRLTPTWSVNLGLRYELATAPTEVNGLTEVGYSTDTTNFGPRFGVAWNPRRGNTTIRAGYGISYGSIFPVTYQFARFNPPAIRVLEIQEPDIANLFSLAAQSATERPRVALNELSPDLVTPYSHLYTLAVERNLPGPFFLRVAYMGIRSFHLFTQDIYNRARPSTDPNVPNTTQTIDLRRPDPRFASIARIESNSIAYYDAAQIALEKRASHGLAFRATYTFGKNIDLGGDFTNTASGVESPREVGISSVGPTGRVADLKGLSLFDTPHAFSLSYTYTLPSPRTLNGWKAAWLQGWQISGTTVFQSGTPWHVHTTDGPKFGNVDGVAFDRPNIRDPRLLGMSFDNPDTSPALLSAGTCDFDETNTFWQCKYFDTHIAPGGRGNMGFNVFRKDGTNNWNFSLGKSFRLGHRKETSLQFRASFLNFLNHPQFDKPGISVSSPNFGIITNTVNKGRVTQLSLRISF